MSFSVSRKRALRSFSAISRSLARMKRDLCNSAEGSEFQRGHIVAARGLANDRTTLGTEPVAAGFCWLDRGSEAVAKRDIIAIGGSLGAIEAAKALLGRLPGDFPAAV